MISPLILALALSGQTPFPSVPPTPSAPAASDAQREAWRRYYDQLDAQAAERQRQAQEARRRQYEQAQRDYEARVREYQAYQERMWQLQIQQQNANAFTMEAAAALENAEVRAARYRRSIGLPPVVPVVPFVQTPMGAMPSPGYTLP